MDASVVKEPIKITWDMAVVQFERLIKFAAKQRITSSSVDNMLSVEDLYQEGMLKLYDCWNIWCNNPERNKGMDEFGPIFRTSLFRHMKKAGKKMSIPLIDLEEETVESIADSHTEDVVENMYMQHGINHLNEILENVVAKELLSELLNPSADTLFQVWADRKRKEMIRSQGKKVNIPKDNTIRMKHIIKALKITTKQYDMAMLEIKQKGRLVLAEV